MYKKRILNFFICLLLQTLLIISPITVLANDEVTINTLDNKVNEEVVEDFLPTKVSVVFNGDEKTSKGITWHTKANCKSDIEYIKSNTVPTNFKHSLKATGISNEVSIIGGFSHKVTLSNLAPGSKYYYRVGDASKNIWSAIGSFKTETINNKALKFIFVDDSQGKNQDEYKISAKTFQKASEYFPDSDFFIHGGDLVNTSSKPEEWHWFFEEAKDFFMNNTFMSVPGNHDAQNNTYNNHFNFNYPKQNTKNGTYYSFNYGPAHFTMLNTNDIVINDDNTKSISAEQKNWMIKDIENARNNGYKWIIVTMHKGTQTASNHIDDSDVVGMRADLQPLFNELKVDIILQGHDHTYSRSKHLNGLELSNTQSQIINGYETVVDPKSQLYISINSSGNKFYKPNEDFIKQFNIQLAKYSQPYLQMFGTFEITGDQLIYNAYTYDAKNTEEVNLYDSYRIIKTNSVPNLPSIEKPTIPITNTKKELVLIGGYNTISKNIEEYLKDFNLSRIYGKNRYETASKISNSYTSSEKIILSSGEKYTDQLTSTVLAKVLESPILLTEKNKLDTEVLKEIERLNPREIIIIGGTNTISKNIETQLSKFHISRINGADRYETAKLVGDRIIEKSGNKNKAILVDGTNFPDAISMTSLASKENIPILLTSPKELNADTREALKIWKTKNIVIGGGEKSVSKTIENSLKHNVSVIRIAGEDRYETSVKVAESIYKDPNKYIFASGETFPDAIVGANYASKLEAPILLIKKDIIPTTVKNYIK